MRWKRIHDHDFFDLQLRFAEALALRSHAPLGDIVALYTNFHRRFGLGLIDGLPTTPRWASYAERLNELAGHAERLAWTREFYGHSAAETPPPGTHVYGCFACDPPDRRGALRIHFANRDDDGESPLGDHKVIRRQAELHDLIAFVASAYPEAISVRGGSWLYHLESYRRLFPPDYVASRRQPERPLGFQGYSSWGQFLDHRGRVRAAAKTRFLANLANLDPRRVADVFPLPALEVTGDIGGFYAWYGVTPPDCGRS